MIISDGINHGKLQSIIVGELKKAGLKHRLKKIILKNVKDNKTVFGAPLAKVPSCSVICCGSTLCVPMVVSEMSTVLRQNASIEGLFRKAGSQTRQKDIKRLLDAGGCVSEGHHPIDIASVLKLYLRCLPEPLISAEVQDLLLRCRLAAGEDALKPILHTLLLLPVLHVHLLHYVMELLNYVASRHKNNLMDSSNLAIVMAPSIMPLPAAASTQRLEHHVALVKLFIENAQHIGVLTDELMSQLDDDTEAYVVRQKKRRSGSINRVLSGLRRMVSGNVNTPAKVRDHGRTPILSKSAAKRKFDGYEGISAKKKKDIKQNLAQKELTFTPMKMSLADRKKLRLSFLDNKRTPATTSDENKTETSVSSEDLLASSEHLFDTHDTIDLSPVMKRGDKDYVRISKLEYEEIKSRVSAIETRLSREFTDIIPRVEPLQQVQNVYQQTLEDVAMLDCSSSDQLARRLSKELKIRPSDKPKIMRSPSARKIGTIRRRSKENGTKLVRHKSWNVSSQSSHNVDRFYPYIALRRERTSTTRSDLAALRPKSTLVNDCNSPAANNVANTSAANQKYQLRNRNSGDCNNLNKTIGKPRKRRSLNNSLNATASDSSINTTLNLTGKSDNSMQNYQNVPNANINKTFVKDNSQQKWKSAATFFMEKTGEIDSAHMSGRPSVNRLRSQNAGAVLAKARLFETSSDRSSDRNDKVHAGFARKPRVSGQCATRNARNVAPVKPRIEEHPSVTTRTRQAVGVVAPTVPTRNRNYQGKDDYVYRQNVRTSPPIKKAMSPPPNPRTPQSISMKNALYTPKTFRTPAMNAEARKKNTPMKAVHISPRRKSPRQKCNVRNDN